MSGEYAKLELVLAEALLQASVGKGHKRHSSGESFEDQPICEISRRLGLAFPLGQAVKKIYESKRLSHKQAKHELLGAINYLAAAIILIDEDKQEIYEDIAVIMGP
jgi:hypothetical protein